MNAIIYTIQYATVARPSRSPSHGFSIAPASIVERIGFFARGGTIDARDACVAGLWSALWRMGNGGMNELRCARSPEEEAEVEREGEAGSSWMEWCDLRADCTDIRLSWRRYTGWSAKPLKLTTLGGLGVEGTEASGVLKGSRGESPWPPSDEGRWSSGTKKLVEGTGGTSVPEVEGREDDAAECPDELEGMGVGWAMLGAADRGPAVRDRQAYNDVQAR